MSLVRFAIFVRLSPEAPLSVIVIQIYHSSNFNEMVGRCSNKISLPIGDADESIDVQVLQDVLHMMLEVQNEESGTSLRETSVRLSGFGLHRLQYPLYKSEVALHIVFYQESLQFSLLK